MSTYGNVRGIEEVIWVGLALSSSVFVETRFLAAFLNFCILTAYITGLTI